MSWDFDRDNDTWQSNSGQWPLYRVYSPIMTLVAVEEVVALVTTELILHEHLYNHVEVRLSPLFAPLRF